MNFQTYPKDKQKAHGLNKTIHRLNLVQDTSLYERPEKTNPTTGTKQQNPQLRFQKNPTSKARQTKQPD